MNPRRLERSPFKLSSKRSERLQKYLKPGALAQLRNSRIISRSRLPHIQNSSAFLTTFTSSSSLPSAAEIAARIATVDGLPCFAVKIDGPRFPQRKKLVASKSVFFVGSSNPSSPVPEASDL